MLEQKQGEYTARDIQVLEGLEAVRKRPGMYIGSTDQRGLHHLAYEVVDNAIDEAMAGFCDRISVLLHADNSVSVSDNGRGIPVDTHATTKKSALETIMTTLHAGGKFDHGAYKVSGGLHGVGASVVNALSEHVRVEVRRDGHLYHQDYTRGKPLEDITDDGKLPKEEASQTGTTLHFLPDSEVFPSITMDPDILLTRFREMAYLNKGIWLSLSSELRPADDKTFYFEGGIGNFVQHLNRGREVLQDPPFYLNQVVDSTTIEVSLQYNTGFYETTLAFANCINTVDGGSHLAGFRAGLTRAINNYARKQKLVKDDRTNLSGDDVREGLTAIVSVRLAEPQFEGQTKGKLGNAETKTQVEQAIVQHLEFYLEEHPHEARRIIDKCLTSQLAREAARKARDLVIRKNAMDGGSLPGKLADCSERNPELSELFVVEGPSAGGSAKEGRDRRTQAILPLRGKILNVEKARADKMLAHEEIRVLITAIGAGFGEDFNAEKLRYHKVIIMTDADVDGAHIRTLLLTFFFRNMRELIDSGYLYIAQPPLYRLARGRSVEYKFAEADKEKWVATQLYRRLSIRAAKGNGQNGDEGLAISGAPLHAVVQHLKEFQTWSTGLANLGLVPDLVGILLQGAAEKHYSLTAADTDTVAAIVAWFEKQGFTVKSPSKRGDKLLEVEGYGTINLTQLLASTPLQRCFELYPRVSHLVKGHTYGVTKRDAEIGSDVPWYELAPLLERQSDKSGMSIQRYKGLGEMNPDQLWETTMDPTIRTLLRVEVEDAAAADTIFNELMGDEVEPRRNYIQAHAKSVRNLDV